MALTAREIQDAYVTFFNRAADTEGFTYWTSYAGSISDLYATFAQQTEYTSVYGGKTTEQQITTVYQNLFNRAPDAEGLAYWQPLVEAGTITLANLALAVNRGAQGTDTTALSGKIDAAIVTTDAAVAAALPGTTFTLTTVAEDLVGTSAADTFNAVVTTLTAGDAITGGAGIDTLNFTGTTNVALPAANITGVEIINVRQTGAALASTDLSLIAGETNVNLVKSNQAATFTNMAAGGQYGVVGNESVTNTGALAIGYVAAATAGVLNYSGGTLGAQAVTITGTGLLSQTINSTGAANVTGAVAGAASTTSTTINATTGLTTGAATNLGATVTVTGAGAVDLSTNALQAGVTTFNAAQNSGGVTVALGSAVTQTVTGSSAADVITSGAVLTTGSVNAGDGTDVLDIGANVAHVNTTTLAAKYTNFETMRMSGTLDMALVSGITAVQTMDAATLTNMSAAQAAAVQIRANNADGTGDAMSFSLATSAGTADVLSITTGTGTTTASAKDIAALTMNGFETLNIATNAGPTSTAGAGGANDRTTTVASFTADKLTTINLTGTAVTLSNVATTLAVTVNGTALTGNGLAAATTAGLTVAGSAVAGSTINGSEVRDVFTIGAEGSAYNGNGGNDSITTTVALLVADGVTDGTINGGDGTDTLTVSDTTGVTLTDNHFTKLSNMETLALTATGADDVSITVGGTFNAAFANGATITTGTMAATQDVALVGGLATVDVSLTIDATSLVGTAAEVHNIVTGTGDDTVTFTGDDTYVGVAGAAQGTITISTGAGADTISVTTGTSVATTSTTGQHITITGGTGADNITLSGINGDVVAAAAAVMVVASGDSGVTVGTWDKITGISLGAEGTGTIADRIDFAGTGAVATIATSTDFGTILSHALTNGVATFDDAAVHATALVISATNLADVVGYLAANTATADAVAFLYDDNGDGVNDSSMIYSNQAADSLVQLVGTTVLGISATTTTATAGFVVIA
ncbi:DUF4214 domain-containing protein [Burkholderiaceae bacterium]|nr:DUF4214 domain-containing protein [Burkholderiaceae bacterium]